MNLMDWLFPWVAIVGVGAAVFALLSIGSLIDADFPDQDDERLR